MKERNKCPETTSVQIIIIPDAAQLLEIGETWT